MRFHILLGNHGNSYQSLQLLGPLVSYLRSALSVCGHEVTVAREAWDADAVNLLLENFPHPEFWSAEIRKVRQDYGYVVGVVATELMVNGVIPYGKQGIHLAAGTQDAREQEDYLLRRMEGFNAIAPEVDFVWSFVERTAREYEGRCRLSKFFPVGHVAPLPEDQRRAPRDIDVAFFGSMTPHRTAVLGELGRHAGLNVVAVGRGTPAGVLPDYVIFSLLDRAKIGLNLTLCAVDESPGVDPRFASCVRVVHMLERDLCVVSEDIPLDNPYRNYMVSSPPAELANACLRLLKSGEWRERGVRMASRFREEMQVAKVCTPVIDATLAALDAPV